MSSPSPADIKVNTSPLNLQNLSLTPSPLPSRSFAPFSGFPPVTGPVVWSTRGTARQRRVLGRRVPLGQEGLPGQRGQRSLTKRPGTLTRTTFGKGIREILSLQSRVYPTPTLSFNRIVGTRKSPSVKFVPTQVGSLHRKTTIFGLIEPIENRVSKSGVPIYDSKEPRVLFLLARVILKVCLLGVLNKRVIGLMDLDYTVL